jgi:hypothetical protein
VRDSEFECTVLYQASDLILTFVDLDCRLRGFLDLWSLWFLVVDILLGCNLTIFGFGIEGINF